MLSIDSKIVKMKIAVIGTGNVGSALSLGFIKAGHEVVFGVRNPDGDFKGKQLATAHRIPIHNIPAAAGYAELIVLSTPASAAGAVAASLGDVQGKIIIDTMNSAFNKHDHFSNTADAVLACCNAVDVVKCFNTTGAENMANPVYNGKAIDMFVAGSSKKAKQAAIQLAKDIGFGEVYDFGGNDKFELIEQWAMCWINLAILQQQGRNLAFTVVKR